MKYRVTVNGRVHEVSVDGAGVVLDGTPVAAALRPVGGTPSCLLVIDGAIWSRTLEPGSGPGRWQLQLHGERHDVEVVDERTAHIRSRLGAAAAQPGPAVLKAPMPGLVVRVLVEPGQAVAAGTGLVVLEAMKMENELKAPVPATVARVEVRAGQAVERGQVLLHFDGMGGDGPPPTPIRP
jgi:biotin carboxyl carrier protein